MATKAGSKEGNDAENKPKTASYKVFEAARELFYRRGVRAVGVDEIVCEAGVTKPSLYRAFKSKDELVTACLKESAREGREAIDDTLAKCGADPQQRLRAVVQQYADRIACPEFRGCAISNVAIELPETGHPGRAVIEECKSDLRSRMAELARDLPVKDPGALADGIILVIEGAFATHHVFGSQGPAQSLVATCDALIQAHLQSSR